MKEEGLWLKSGYNQIKTDQTHYRRENLFLNALMVLAIMGAISAGKQKNRTNFKQTLFIFVLIKLRKVPADLLLTCGFSRPACGPAPPPLGAEGRAGPGGEFNREEKERLDSPLESVVDAFILKEAGRGQIS